MTARYMGGHARNSRISSVLNDLPERVAEAVANGVVFETSAEWAARLPARVELLRAAGIDAYVLGGDRLFAGQFPHRQEITGRYALDQFCAARGITAEDAASAAGTQPICGQREARASL